MSYVTDCSKKYVKRPAVLARYMTLIYLYIYIYINNFNTLQYILPYLTTVALSIGANNLLELRIWNRNTS